MKKIKMLLVVSLILVLGLLTACGSATSGLVGRWEATDVGIYAGARRLSRLEFFSDGTYTSNSPNFSGSYSVENSRMRLSGILFQDLSVSFKVSGNQLTLSDDDGEYEYSKVD